MNSNLAGFRAAVLVALILNVFVACLRADHAQRTSDLASLERDERGLPDSALND